VGRTDLLCNDGILGIIRLGGRQQRLKRQKGRLESESWTPLVFQNVQTNGAVLAANVGMPGRNTMLAPHLHHHNLSSHHSQRYRPSRNASTLAKAYTSRNHGHIFWNCVQRTRLWSRTASSAAQKDTQLFQHMQRHSLQNIECRRKIVIQHALDNGIL
jgi:hypothetical protein